MVKANKSESVNVTVRENKLSGSARNFEKTDMFDTFFPIKIIDTFVKSTEGHYVRSRNELYAIKHEIMKFR
jgi:hypothetical protein